MKIININGTSGNNCKCGSWLQHWINISGRAIEYCPVENCLNKAEVGAHVQKDSPDDQSWYILPLCQKHNMVTNFLHVSPTWKLVSANVRETCEK